MATGGFLLENMAIYALNPLHMLRFRRKVGYFPNVAQPTTYQEKIAWRKIFDRNPLFAVFTDKLATKDFLRERAPGLPVARTLWVGDRLTREAFDLLDDKTVLKANHGCDMSHYPGRERLTFDELRRLSDGWLRRTHGRNTWEHAYRGARKLLFIEELLVSPDRPLIDIGVRAMDGRPVSVWYYIFNKTPDQKIAYFTPQGERVPAFDALVKDKEILDPALERRQPVVDCVAWAALLSRGLDYARFDFLVVGDTVHGGEITLYSLSGLTDGRAPAQRLYSDLLSSAWDLRKSDFFARRHTRVIERYKRKLRIALDRRHDTMIPSAAEG